jgi:hypothetical protein
MSYHIIISYHTISYHIVSYHISYIIPYHIIPYHIVSYHIIIISYHIIPYHIIPYRIISYHISYHTIPYRIISYHIEPGFRRNEVSMREWVRHSTLPVVTMNIVLWMTSQLVCSWFQWLRGCHCYDGAWFSNGIKTLFRTSAALPPLPVGFLWLSLSIRSVTARVPVFSPLP